MAPTPLIRGFSSSVGTSPVINNSQVLTKPTLAIGDLLIIFAIQCSASTTVTNTVTCTGFSASSLFTGSQTEIGFTYLTRTATSSDVAASSYTLTSSANTDSLGGMMVSVGATYPYVPSLDGAIGTPSIVNTVNPIPSNSVTTTHNNELVIWFGGDISNSQVTGFGPYTIAPPTGFTSVATNFQTSWTATTVRVPGFSVATQAVSTPQTLTTPSGVPSTTPSRGVGLAIPVYSVSSGAVVDNGFFFGA